MSKYERRVKGMLKYRKRLRNLNIKCDDYSYKTTGKPCSCALCSPGKVEEKAKYRMIKKPSVKGGFIVSNGMVYAHNHKCNTNLK